MDDDGEPVRVPFDTERYARRSQEGPCFVCAILAGHPDYPHHVVYEDEGTIAFLKPLPDAAGLLPGRAQAACRKLGP
jgi:hypothetical protein